MQEKLRTAWYVFAAALVLTLTAAGTLVASLPECPTEDSTNCIWHADTSGNRVGSTFIDINGWVIYL